MSLQNALAAHLFSAELHQCFQGVRHNVGFDFLPLSYFEIILVELSSTFPAQFPMFIELPIRIEYTIAVVVFYFTDMRIPAALDFASRGCSFGLNPTSCP